MSNGKEMKFSKKVLSEADLTFLDEKGKVEAPVANTSSAGKAAANLTVKALPSRQATSLTSRNMELSWRHRRHPLQMSKTSRRSGLPRTRNPIRARDWSLSSFPI